MSQHPMTIANQAGASFRADLNTMAAAIVSQSSGATAPSTTYAYMFWGDTTTGLLKQRNGANSGWISIGYLADLGIQSGTQTVAAVGGTVDAITLTLDPAPTALTTTIKRFRAAGANTSTTPTANTNGLGAKVIVKGSNSPLAVGDIPGAGAWMLLVYDATLGKEVLLNPAAGVVASTSAQIQTIPTPTFASNAMTIPAAAFALDFRSATLGSGVVTPVSSTSAALVVPASATLGTVSGVQSDLLLLELNNAAATEHALINRACGQELPESGVISTTAISAGATSANVAYSTNARMGLAYRVVGVYRGIQTTAGQWAAAMSLVQGIGGRALTFTPFTTAAQATTSGTSSDFTGVIPFGAKRITMNWMGGSSNGTNGFVARIGTSAGFVSSGYVGTVNVNGAPQVLTTGVGLMEAGGSFAASTYNIRCTWTLVDAVNNKWMGEAFAFDTGGTYGARTAIGYITLPGPADRVQFTTVGGADVFDAGTAGL